MVATWWLRIRRGGYMFELIIISMFACYVSGVYVGKHWKEFIKE